MDGKTLALSSQSPNVKVAGQHYDNLPGIMSAAVEERITKQGFEVERLRENTYARWAYNAWGYSELGKRIEDKRFLDHQPELFS